MTGRLVRLSAVCVTVVLACALVSGCCPSGSKVLESMTLPVEQQTDCRLVPQGDLAGGPAAEFGNPVVTSDSRKVAAIAPLAVGGDAAASRIRDAYAAVYECEPGGPRVRVYAVLFSEPASPERVALLEANPEGVMFKGQLAGVVAADEDVCEPCYVAVAARARRVLAK
jgi:hypothetical protein